MTAAIEQEIPLTVSTVEIDGANVAEWHCARGHLRCDCLRPLIDPWGRTLWSTDAPVSYLSAPAAIGRMVAHIHQQIVDRHQANEQHARREEQLSRSPEAPTDPMSLVDAIRAAHVGGSVQRNGVIYQVIDTVTLRQIYPMTDPFDRRPIERFTQDGWRVHFVSEPPRMNQLDAIIEAGVGGIVGRGESGTRFRVVPGQGLALLYNSGRQGPPMNRRSFTNDRDNWFVIERAGQPSPWSPFADDSNSSQLCDG